MKPPTTMEQYLTEVCLIFNSENRSLALMGRFCVYSHNYNGFGCAVGLYLSKEEAMELDDGELLLRDLYNQYATLRSKLGHFPVDFLADMQRLHDNENLWNKEGLSNIGKEVVKNIISEYKLNISLEEILSKPKIIPCEEKQAKLIYEEEK